MKMGTSDKWILIALAIFAMILIACFVPISEKKGAHIFYSMSSSQGAAENNTEMEIVKVHGMIFNDGEAAAENLTVIVIFTDIAHNEVVKETVKEGFDLPPDAEVEFDSEYLRKSTIPKTEVNISLQLYWMESGQLRTIYSNETEAGYLEGNVTIGPLNPVEREDATPIPPEVYAMRSINIFGKDGITLITNVKINADGTYHVALAPGSYIVDINRTGIDRGTGLPRTVMIEKGQTVHLDIDIDTGIR